MKTESVFYPESPSVKCGQITNKKYEPNLKLDQYDRLIGIEGLYRDFELSDPGILTNNFLIKKIGYYQFKSIVAFLGLKSRIINGTDAKLHSTPWF